MIHATLALLALSAAAARVEGRPAGTPRPTAAQAYAARDHLYAAEKTMRKAEADLSATVDRLWKQMETDPAYTAAQSRAAAARANYDRLSKQALATLKSDANYQAEVAARTKARQALTSAKETGQATDEEKAQLAGDVMTHNAAIHRLESAALNKTPGFRAARSELIASQAQVTKMRAQFTSRVRQNSEWSAAKSAVENSHHEVALAEAEVARTWDRTLGPRPANPIPANPIDAQPIARQPVNAQPIARDPTPGGPKDANPIPGGPKEANPIAGGPKDANPIPGGPRDAQPVAADPIPGGPKPANPVPAAPVPANPPNN